MSNRLYTLTPELLLRAYAHGIFPMADSAASRELHWYDPPLRAIIPLDERFHVPRRLARTIHQQPYELRLNSAFEAVMRACAAPAPDRPKTWINDEIVDLYTTLHRRGHAHSVEAWQDGQLVGGLYGVSLGATFFGESMFSTKRDASKIALVHLVTLLRQAGFTLLDAQFQTEHLSQFGTIEVTRDAYQHLLAGAVRSEPRVLRV
jgi:leucyl/phenylalanyl-tRNA--protein transferase